MALPLHSSPDVPCYRSQTSLLRYSWPLHHSSYIKGCFRIKVCVKHRCYRESSTKNSVVRPLKSKLTMLRNGFSKLWVLISSSYVTNALRLRSGFWHDITWVRQPINIETRYTAYTILLKYASKLPMPTGTGIPGWKKQTTVQCVQ